MSNIDSSGFKYRMDSLGIDQSNLLVAYDFVSGSKFNNGYLDSPPWVTGNTLSGKLNGSYSNIYNKSGSGYLNGSSYISISGKIPSDDFAFLFCYEKLQTGAEILLSSANGNNFLSSSGLTVGLNDANKLYLEYWDPVFGKRSLNHNENIASKNLVFLKKSFGEFQLGTFDPIESSLTFSSTAVSSLTYSHSDSFLIGKSNAYWSTGLQFNGYLDDFYCLSGKFSNNFYSELFSGFYSVPKNGEISGISLFCENLSVLTGTTGIIGTGVTGYTTTLNYTTGYVPTGYLESGYLYTVGTGIIGYENKYIGTVEDGCGFLNPVYVKSPITGNIYASGTTGIYTGLAQIVTPVYENVNLTGLITGNVFTPINISVCSSRTGYYPDYLIIDSGFVSSLGFDSIYSLYENKNIVHNEAYFNTESIYNNINLKPVFDTVVDGWLVSNSYTGYRKNLVFNNGQLMSEGTGISYSDGYLTKYNISGNFFLDGSTIRSNGYADSSDSIIYDYSTGVNMDLININSELAIGTNLVNIFEKKYENYSLFLNGIKLVSGIDYINNQSVFLIPPSSVLIKIDNDYISKNNRIYITGSNNFISLNGSGRFCNNSSQLYTNGLRQYLDQDYLEISKFSILTGNPVQATNNNQFVYSYNQDFWNI